MKTYYEVKLNEKISVIITDNDIKPTKDIHQDRFLMSVYDSRDTDINNGIFARIGTHPTLTGAIKYLEKMSMEQDFIVQTEIKNYKNEFIDFDINAVKFL